MMSILKSQIANLKSQIVGLQPKPAARRNSAFTLVELIVAILLLSIGLLALLSTAIATTRHIESAFAQVEAKALATRDIERLRSRRCSAADSVESGLQRVMVVIERRTVARESADTFYATIAC